MCGGEVSKFDIQRLEEEKTNKVKFEISLFEKITGFKIEKKEIIKIISNLGFKINENNENLDLEIPSWRPDITQPIDIVEEIVRIKGYEHIQTLIPEKSRLKPTLNRQQNYSISYNVRWRPKVFSRQLLGHLQTPKLIIYLEKNIMK